jgi:hypothetical protein
MSPHLHRSTCVAVTHYGTTCGPIIEAFGLARDCLAMDPNTGLMTYDFASTPMSAAIQAGQRNADGSFAAPVCNDLPSSIVSGITKYSSSVKVCHSLRSGTLL